MASGFDGFGSGCSDIQRSRSASRSGYNRKPMLGPIPVEGRPRPLFFSLSDIDLFPAITKCQKPNRARVAALARF